jgi:hypothetical protein
LRGTIAVMPLAAAGHAPHFIAPIFFLENMLAMLLFGVIIAFIAADASG